MSAPALLEVRGLTIEVPTVDGPLRLLDDIWLTVKHGESVGLVGESGSGKSMTLRAIIGLLPKQITITAGEILVDGTDVLHSGPRGGYAQHVRGAGVSMVFQEPAVALNPVLTVGRQITDALAARRGLSKRNAREVAIDLMDRVGIVDPRRRVDAYPFELSGGMRQRVMIAAAIANEPALLLCDEPTTALDVTVQQQVIDLFASLQRERELGLLYVTHDLAVVAQLCTSLAVMRRGRILERGPLQHVFDHPQEDYTRTLLSATPRIEGGRRLRKQVTA